MQIKDSIAKKFKPKKFKPKEVKPANGKSSIPPYSNKTVKSNCQEKKNEY